MCAVSNARSAKRDTQASGVTRSTTNTTMKKEKKPMENTKRKATDEEIFDLWDKIMVELDVKLYSNVLDFGNALWRVFSNNNEVSSSSVVFDAGSFRGTGGRIAEWLNDKNHSLHLYDYIDFYCAETNPLENKIKVWLKENDYEVNQLAKGWDDEV